MSPRLARMLTLAIVAFCAAAMLLHGPIAQLDHYHDFADTRPWLGLPNAADVLSNLGFLFAAALGSAALWCDKTRLIDAGRAGYTLFFAALLLTTAGSSWYHLAPDNSRLVWDRLPIALACAGLLAAVWEETLGAGKQARGLTTVVLALFGTASVAWWRYTDLHGMGDLRPYLLLQLSPLVLIPLWQAAARTPSTERRAYTMAIGLYLLAKACELADQPLLHLFGFISGHTLKHLLSAAAGWVLARNLWRRTAAVSEVVSQTLARIR